MFRRLVTLLKADSVKMAEESVIVGAGGPAAVSPAAAAINSTAQEARIVESNDEYTVIEIVCSCGGKSFVQCNFGGQPAPAVAAGE